MNFKNQNWSLFRHVACVYLWLFPSPPCALFRLTLLRKIRPSLSLSFCSSLSLFLLFSLSASRRPNIDFKGRRLQRRHKSFFFGSHEQQQSRKLDWPRKVGRYTQNFGQHQRQVLSLFPSCLFCHTHKGIMEEEFWERDCCQCARYLPTLLWEGDGIWIF